MGAVLAWLAWAWRWIASSRIVQGAIFVAGVIAYHVYSKWSAKREGAREEREQAQIEAYEREAEHGGDVGKALDELDEQQEERRERESDKDPRARFGRDPWQ